MRPSASEGGLPARLQAGATLFAAMVSSLDILPAHQLVRVHKHTTMQMVLA
jgi:hypothetical protein